METDTLMASISNRKTLPFGSEYGIPIAMRAVRAAGWDDTLFVCGQMDMDGNGVPQANHTIEEQTQVSLDLAYKAVEEVGLKRLDVLKLGVHYVASEVPDLLGYKAFVRSRLIDPGTLVTFTPLESFPSGDGARVEIDALAIALSGTSPRLWHIDDNVQAVRQNELVFASVGCALDAQSMRDSALSAFNASDAALRRVRSSASDACALWMYVPFGLPMKVLDELIVALETLFPKPRPVFTVVRLAGQAEGTFRLDILTVCDSEKVAAALPGNASGTRFSAAIRAGRYAFVGGYFDGDSESGDEQSRDRLAEDSHRAMRHVRESLASVGSSMGEIVFVNAYFVGHKNLERWRANAQIRSQYYEAPGPAATGVEVSGLHPRSRQLTASCIAMCEEKR